MADLCSELPDLLCRYILDQMTTMEHKLMNARPLPSGCFEHSYGGSFAGRILMGFGAGAGETVGTIRHPQC